MQGFSAHSDLSLQNFFQKNLLYFFLKKRALNFFLYFSKRHTFKPKLRKIKKIHPEKLPYTSGNKDFLYFLNSKLFLYFWKRKPRKNSFYFRKWNLLTLQEVLPKPQKPKFLIILQKSYE